MQFQADCVKSFERASFLREDRFSFYQSKIAHRLSLFRMNVGSIPTDRCLQARKPYIKITWPHKPAYFAGAGEAAGVASVADLMLSSFGKFFSRYARPRWVIFP